MAVAMLPSDLPERRLRVLIAEDNAVNQRLAATLLERRGHKVTIAGNGREALTALDKGTFDAVLMDVQMPEMGGFEATLAVREREAAAGRHTPIIAMTARAMKGDRERCLAAGMDAYLTKPLDSRTLWRTVEQMAGLQGPPAQQPGAADPGVSDQVLARMSGDRQLLNEISRLFLEDAPHHLERIRQAILARDAESLRRAVHSLKGAAANFAAQGVVSAARALEESGRAGDFERADAGWHAIQLETERLMATLQRVATNS
jgi:CheY-like chemotaxis protein